MFNQLSKFSLLSVLHKDTYHKKKKDAHLMDCSSFFLIIQISFTYDTVHRNGYNVDFYQICMVDESITLVIENKKERDFFMLEIILIYMA